MLMSNLRIVMMAAIFSLAASTGISQVQAPDTSEYPYWIEMMQDPKQNFFETQKAFEMYWNNRAQDRGNGWKPFKRWEYLMESRVDEFGNLPDPDHNHKEYNRYFKLDSKSSAIQEEDHWQELGPVSLPANGTGQPNGLGRINCIGFHPTNPNILYVGAASGGLWKTTNGGTTWEVKTDTLPTLAVSSIVVNPQNPNVIYMGSGDRDGNDAPGLGVYKSTDAGETWFLSNSSMGSRIVGKLLMHPNDTSMLLAATNGGIYKSTNAGNSWSRTSSNSSHYKDLEFMPGNPSIVYSTYSGRFMRSSNTGDSWTQITSGLPSSNRLVIGVTPDDSTVVYALLTNNSTFKGMYLSTDGGLSFTVRSTTPNIMDYSSTGSGSSGQAWYDLCIAVDPDDKDVVYAGGVNIFKSTNAGSTWSINAHWTGSNAPDIHADQHELDFSPDGKLYSSNDGGLYVTSNGGNTWIDKSNGLAIAQVYKIGQSALSSSLTINGYQDNGTAIYNGNWKTEIGGDGMECIIDPTNSQYMYGALYYGDIRRSSNGGTSFSRIARNGTNGITESGAWVTPYILKEGDATTMFVGYRNVWKSTNVKATSTGGVNWTKISNNLGSSNSSTIRVLENSQADNNILYISRVDDKLFRSDNINATSPTYVNLTSGLPINDWPRDIEAHPSDVNKVYMVVGNNVYASDDKGASWTDISGTLPNVSMNAIVYDTSSSGDLYVGTDIGVFFKGSWMSDWIPFSGGLPVSIEVRELEIFYAPDRSNSLLKAATYGRGLWQSDLYIELNVDLEASHPVACANQVIQFTDISEGFYTNLEWEFPGGNPSFSNDPNPSVTYANAGSYTVKLKIWNDFEVDSVEMQALISIDSTPDVSVSPQNPSISPSGNITLMASGAVDYTWSPADGLNTTQGAIVIASPNQTTTYSVKGVNNNCMLDSVDVEQVTVTVLSTGLSELGASGNIIIYPNPADDLVMLKFNEFKDVSLQISVLDLAGKQVYSNRMLPDSDSYVQELNLTDLPAGTYIISFESQDNQWIQKLILR